MTDVFNMMSTEKKPSLLGMVVQGIEDGSYLGPFNLPAIKQALEKGADVDEGDAKGRTSLMMAVSSEETEDLVKLLLNYGANVNARDCDGNSVLHYALQMMNQSVIRTLLRHGANVNACDNEGRNALQKVLSKQYTNEYCRREMKGIVTLLLDYGVKIAIQPLFVNSTEYSDDNRYSSLHYEVFASCSTNLYVNITHQLIS